MKRVIQKKNVFKFLLILLVNIAVIALIAIIEFGTKKVDADKINPLYFRYEYLIYALLFVILNIFVATLKFAIMMKKVFGKVSIKVAFETVMVGFYYNNITPLTVGGQPFQIYYLSKKGFSSGASATIPTTEIIGQDLSMAALVLLAHIFVYTNTIGFKIDAIWLIASAIGFVCYLLAPTGIFIFSKHPQKLESFVKTIIHLLSKIRIVKNEEMTKEKTIKKLSEYVNNFEYLKKTPSLFVLIIFLSLIQRLSICIIPYFIMHAFSSDISFIVALASTVILTSAVTFIPTPGNSGASEGVFYAIFSSLNTGHVFWATLIWRFFIYYIYLFSGIVFAIKTTQYNVVTNNNVQQNENSETN